VIYLLYTVHLVVCLFLILVVLLQQGKGADLSVFGGGSTQTAFGARGAATLLHKLTVVSFVLFILTTMSIAIYRSSPGGGSSVMSDVGQEQAAPETEPEAEAATDDATPAAEAAPAPTGEVPDGETPADGGTGPADTAATPDDAG